MRTRDARISILARARTPLADGAGHTFLGYRAPSEAGRSRASAERSPQPNQTATGPPPAYWGAAASPSPALRTASSIVEAPGLAETQLPDHLTNRQAARGHTINSLPLEGLRKHPARTTHLTLLSSSEKLAWVSTKTREDHRRLDVTKVRQSVEISGLLAAVAGKHLAKAFGAIFDRFGRDLQRHLGGPPPKQLRRGQRSQGA